VVVDKNFDSRAEFKVVPESEAQLVGDEHFLIGKIFCKNKNCRQVFRQQIVNVWVHVKGPVQCFSMQFVINKCFLLTLKKIGTDPSCRFQKKK